MTVYIWIAVLGISGFFSLVTFFYFWLKDSALRKELKLKKVTLLADLLMLGLSGGAITLTILFLLQIKDQLVQLSN